MQGFGRCGCYLFTLSPPLPFLRAYVHDPKVISVTSIGIDENRKHFNELVPTQMRRGQNVVGHDLNPIRSKPCLLGTPLLIERLSELIWHHCMAKPTGSRASAHRNHFSLNSGEASLANRSNHESGR